MSDPMGDPDDVESAIDPASAGVAHLQRAGREFVSAARSFLDAVEEVVEDRTRLGELAESFTGFLGELSEAARGGSTPWGTPVRPTPRSAADTAAKADTAADTAADPAHDGTHGTVSGSGTTPAASPTSTGDADADRPQPGARVRRIPVD